MKGSGTAGRCVGGQEGWGCGGEVVVMRAWDGEGGRGTLCEREARYQCQR